MAYGVFRTVRAFTAFPVVAPCFAPIPDGTVPEELAGSCPVSHLFQPSLNSGFADSSPVFHPFQPFANVGCLACMIGMVGLDSIRVMQALRILADQPRGNKRLLRQVEDYSMPNVSDKVLRIILSYTDYVNRVVWHKQD